MFRICKGKAEYYNSMFYEMPEFKQTMQQCRIHC